MLLDVQPITRHSLTMSDAANRYWAQLLSPTISVVRDAPLAEAHKVLAALPGVVSADVEGIQDLEAVAAASFESQSAFWLAWMCRQLHNSALPPEADSLHETWSAPAIAAIGSQYLGALFNWLDAVDADRRNSQEPVLYLSFCALDSVDRRLVPALLSLALTLANRYTKIRVKAFISDKLFNDSLRFTDASKLLGRSVQLTQEASPRLAKSPRRKVRTTT